MVIFNLKNYFDYLQQVSVQDGQNQLSHCRVYFVLGSNKQDIHLCLDWLPMIQMSEEMRCCPFDIKNTRCFCLLVAVMNAKHLCLFLLQIGFYKHGLLHMHFVAEPTIGIGGKSNILTRHLHFDINWYSYLRMARKLQALLQEFIGKFILKFYQDLFLLSFLCSTTLNELCLQIYDDLILYLVRICFDYGLCLLRKYLQIRHNKFCFNLFHIHTKLLRWILHSFPCYQVVDLLILYFTYQVSSALYFP